MEVAITGYMSFVLDGNRLIGVDATGVNPELESVKVHQTISTSETGIVRKGSNQVLNSYSALLKPNLRCLL